MKHSELRHQPRHVNPRIQAEYFRSVPQQYLYLHDGIAACHPSRRYGSICAGKILLPWKQLPVFHGSVRDDVPGIRNDHPRVLHGNLLGHRKYQQLGTDDVIGYPASGSR